MVPSSMASLIMSYAAVHAAELSRPFAAGFADAAAEHESTWDLEQLCIDSSASHFRARPEHSRWRAYTLGSYGAIVAPLHGSVQDFAVLRTAVTTR